MKLLKLFLIFLKIGAFTFGGGYAMIPLIQDEVVEKNKYLTNEEFLNTIALAQSSPGALAVNSSIIIGYKLNGFLGALACVLGVILPSIVIILLISIYLYKYRHNKIVDKIFMGIKPAIVALITSAVYKLIKASNYKKKILLIPLLVTFVIVVIKINPIFIIIISALSGVLYNKYNLNKKE